MSYLLRVELPDVPGSLGRLATTIGLAGGNIEAIEIVEHTGEGKAVDDVFLSPLDGVMPDSIVSACNVLDGVRVIWISRYAAGGQLFLDLEVVEEMSHQPQRAVEILLAALPAAFRVDWAAHIRREPDGIRIVRGTPAAPERLPEGIEWPADLESGRRVAVPPPHDDTLVAVLPLGPDDLIVIARRGGPEILDSEIARLTHLAGLATSIGRAPTRSA